VTIEKEGARIFLAIPVRVETQTERKVTVEPKQAQIAVAGPSSRLDQLKPADITARIKVADLEPGQHRLAAEIVLPPGFQLVRCEPSLFDVTVR
jgi:YbbR domain-containing protein